MQERSPGNEELIGRISQAAVRPRPVWSSGRAFLISAIAGVVGLGAIWRFPYLVGEHGGGSFILAYLVCIAAVAVPLAAIEAAGGHAAKQSPVGLFRTVGGRAGVIFGWAPIIVTVALMSYYFVITGWTLGYTTDALTDNVRSFDSFTGGYASLWWFVAVGALTYMILLRGVGALERVSKYLVALLALSVLGLAIYSQTLAGAGDSLRFLASIDSAHLLSSDTWRAAAGQAFYQVGIGQGFLIAYGSYSPHGLRMVRATATLAAANVIVAVTAALMIFPIVFTFGIEPDAGAQLAFDAMPAVLSDMRAGILIGVVFFTLLFVAALTSCLGGAAVAISALRDEFHMRAQPAALAAIACIILLGIPSALSYTSTGLTIGGDPFLDVVDRTTGSGLVIAVGLIGAGWIAWRMPIPQLARAMRMLPRRIGRVTADARVFVLYGRLLPIGALAFLAWSLAT